MGGARPADRVDREVAGGHEGRGRAAVPAARHDQGVRPAASRGSGRDRPDPPYPSRLLHRAGRDRRPAPAPGRAARMAGDRRRRARQHRRGDAGCAGGRGGGRRDAARSGRRVVLVVRRAQGRGQRVPDGGPHDPGRGPGRDPCGRVRVRHRVHDVGARARREQRGGMDPQGRGRQPHGSRTRIRR